MNETPSDLELREASPDDAPLVFSLTLAAYAEYRHTLVPPSGVFSESLEDVRRELEHGGGLIATLAGEAVGCARYEVDPAGGFLYFGRLSVLPAARRRGIAAAIVRGLEARARALGLPEVRLGVRLSLPHNIRLYTKLGYETYDHEERAVFGVVSAEMRRRLLPRSARPAGGVLALFGGAAGAGKSTIARGWCATRPRALHLQLDTIWESVVQGRADPLRRSGLASEQYALSARACVAAARPFLAAGYDVAIDDVFVPAAFTTHWKPLLDGLDWRLLIIHPELEIVLARGAGRQKRVPQAITREQYAACERWPEPRRLDTSGYSVEDSVRLAARAIAAEA
ncbi:MAG TPA: GNAT family N-acetyltransferase [Dehalococcoidia bacterium]|nr:GNAT family N-acetyltransferase [Dehalococcoidia bacterium]